MNQSRSMRPGLALGVLLAAAAATTDAFAKESVLLDFGDTRKDPDGTVIREYEYAYQDWGGGRVIDMPGRGALVKAPSGSGGIGENRTGVRFDKTPALEVVYVVGNANKASSISLALTDKDGTEHQWNVPLAGQSPGLPLRHRITLANPDNALKPGKTPGLDLKRIATWQLRGNFTPPPVEVLLVKVAAVD